MSSDKICCVPGCKSSSGGGCTLHQFPNPEKDRERFNTWMLAIKNIDLHGLENKHIFKYRRVCHLHFEAKYICWNNRISNIAVPTLNLPGSITLKCCTLDKRPCKIIDVPQQSTSTGSIALECSTPARRPLCKIIDVTQPSTSTGPSLKDKKYLVADNMEVTQEKENINPDCNINILPENTPEQNKIDHDHLEKRSSVKREKTDIEKKLYKQILAARVKITKMKSKIKKQSDNIKAAKDLSTNPAFLEVLENCTNTAKLLINIQCRESNKNKKGRRFSLDEKIASLSIYKQSPKAYRFLRKIFVLPAQQTLVKCIQRMNLKPGINKNLFEQLKNRTKKMSTEEKLCVLLFDEVSLKPNLSYNERKDKITGLIDNGIDRKSEFADHAQVFMVRGLIHNYKQAIAYTFTASATKGPELAKQIKQVVIGLQEAGFIVVSSVCDQGTNNRQAVKILLEETRGVYIKNGEEPKENIILINGQEIIPIYDPPHLLKGIRNNLLSKDLEFVNEDKRKVAKWAHLKLLYNENPGYRGVRLIPKLTENHINPAKYNKMKVKFASQIFSRTVASNMGYLADKNVLPQECKDTADFIIFMDNLFDSVNGSYAKNKNAKPLLGPATPYSVHHKTWEEAIKILKSIKFIEKNNKKVTVPSVTNWVWTLKSIEILLNKLKNDFNITSVWLRHLNQDPLENFFGAVRSQGCRNTNPTCDQFESAFATILINNLNSVHTRGNCETDYCEELHSLIINENVIETSTCTFDFSKINTFECTLIDIKYKDPRLAAPIEYMSGYYLKNLKTKIFKNCNICSNECSQSEEVVYIQYREYAGRRWLCTPSRKLVEIVSNMHDIIYEILSKNINQLSLTEIIKTSFYLLLDFNYFSCEKHNKKLIEYLMKLVIRCMTFNYCKNINKILAGSRNVDDNEDNLQIKAHKINKKYYKRKGTK